jgi:hypothetical protein
MPQDDPDYTEADATRLTLEHDKLVASRPTWRMAPQGFTTNDFALAMQPEGDGYMLDIRIGLERRRVHFDPGGRMTRVRILT